MPTTSRRRVEPALLVILAGVVAALHIGKLPPAIPVLREALGLTQGRCGFFDASTLGEDGPGERMELRKISPVAGSVQSRRRLGNMLANNRNIADLLVAEAQLVVGEANGLGIVRLLGVTQGSAEQGDGA